MKLGGSIITLKDKEHEADITTINRLIDEIKYALERDRELQLILVHGGGSFPHPVAKRYSVKDGFLKNNDKLSKDERIKGFTLTARAASEINEIIWERFLDKGIPALSIRTSSIAISENHEIIKMFVDSIDFCINNGIIPILYGDVIFDKVWGNSIASGEKIIMFLAKQYKPQKVIIATDVDGVFDSNPKRNPNAKLIKEYTSAVNKKKIEITSEMDYADVTGGMKHKVNALVRLAEQNIKSIVINGKIKNRVYKALIGEQVIGTYF